MGYVEELRRLVGSQQILVAGARAVIQDAAGRVLLQLRGDFGTWGLPAGALELGESMTTTLHREVREETGLWVKHAIPFGLYSDPQYCVTYPNGDQIQPITLAFLVDDWEGEPLADGHESLRLEFFDLDRLPPPEQMVPSHRRTAIDSRRFRDTGVFIVD